MLKPLGVYLGEHQDDSHQGKDDGGQAQALGVGALVDVEGLGNGQPQAPQGGVAGCDGQDDDAQQRDDAAHAA